MGTSLSLSATGEEPELSAGGVGSRDRIEG